MASLFGLANEEKATHTHCFFRSTLRNGHSTLRNGRSAERNARSTLPNEHFIAYLEPFIRAEKQIVQLLEQNEKQLSP